MDNERLELQKRYKYIFDVYSMSLAQYTLLKRLFEDYNPTSTIKETEIVLIQALIDSIVCNLCKVLVDTKENKITINKLMNAYNIYVDIYNKENNTQYQMVEKKKLPDIKIIADKIRIRRNNITAHSALEGLSESFVKETNLMFEYFEQVFEYMGQILGFTCVVINGYCISGWNKTTGKFADDIARKVDSQYEIIKNCRHHYNLMAEYMTKNHLNGPIRSEEQKKEDKSDGQTENAHAE